MWGLAAAGALLLTAFVGAWPEVYAVTIWPAWVFAVPGLGLVLALYRRQAIRLAWPALLVHLALLLLIAEEPRSMARALIPVRQDLGLRVEVLNVGLGSVDAAREAVRPDVDLVLLQESPGRGDLEALARGAWGEKGAVLSGPDASILVHGRLEPLPIAKGTHNFVAARVWPEKGGEWIVVSLRLNPPVFSLNYLSPSTWRAYADNKRARIQELAEIARWLEDVPSGTPVLIAGDFNTPPDPVTQASLRPRFRDAFVEAGRGWGATGINDFPMVRIDQIWLSEELRAIEVQAAKTLNSDHRRVTARIAGSR